MTITDYLVCKDLSELKARADLVIDTSELSASSLRAKLVEAFLGPDRATI